MKATENSEHVPTPDLTSLRERYLRIATGHVCDALEHRGIGSAVLPDRIRPLTRHTRFAGPAVTLRLALSRTGRESRRLTEILDDRLHPGCALVIDANGQADFAIFGLRAALTAQRHGVVGVVINGASRDIPDLDELELPVHALGRAVTASEGRYQGVDIDADVVVDAILIRPGDWLVADATGICVVPSDRVTDILALAEERERIDRDSVAGLRSGRSLRDVHRHFEDDDQEAMRHTE